MESSLKTKEVQVVPIELQLGEVAQNIKSVVENIEEIPDEEKEFSVDLRYRDVQSRKFQTGSFCFWGGLTQKNTFHMYPTEKQYMPNIKNLRIPESVRKKGLASKVVKVWEETLEEYGFDVFIVTNISSIDAISFWEGLGYAIPFEEKEKKIPYYMVKDIKSLKAM